MKQKRTSVISKARLKNLIQYQGLSEEELEEKYQELLAEAAMDIEEDQEELESRIQEHLDSLGQDYDLDDMKANDRLQLRALAMAEIQLSDLEKAAYTVRKDISGTSVLMIEKLNNTMSKLRSDISDISDDLQLTRRIRKQSSEASVMSYLDDLRTKARKFYKERMLYVFCPNCRRLLTTLWLLYPDESNTIVLKCSHCGNRFNQELSGLYKTDNKNLEDVVVP